MGGLKGLIPSSLILNSDSDSILKSKTVFLKKTYVSINGFQSFSCQGPPKITCNLAAGPSSQNVLFQGQPPRNKDLSGKPIRSEYVFKHVHALSRFFKNSRPTSS